MCEITVNTCCQSVIRLNALMSVSIKTLQRRAAQWKRASGAATPAHRAG